MRNISKGARLAIALLVALAFVFGGFRLRAQDDGFGVAGRVSATDSEADEGYFGIGQETVVVAKPGSGAHSWLKRHVGQSVRVNLEAIEITH